MDFLERPKTMPVSTWLVFIIRGEKKNIYWTITVHKELCMILSYIFSCSSSKISLWNILLPHSWRKKQRPIKIKSLAQTQIVKGWGQDSQTKQSDVESPYFFTLVVLWFRWNYCSLCENTLFSETFSQKEIHFVLYLQTSILGS